MTSIQKMVLFAIGFIFIAAMELVIIRFMGPFLSSFFKDEAWGGSLAIAIIFVLITIVFNVGFKTKFYVALITILCTAVVCFYGFGWCFDELHGARFRNGFYQKSYWYVDDEAKIERWNRFGVRVPKADYYRSVD